jgi:chromosome segregation ATPase
MVNDNPSHFHSHSHSDKPPPAPDASTRGQTIQRLQNLLTTKNQTISSLQQEITTKQDLIIALQQGLKAATQLQSQRAPVHGGHTDMESTNLAESVKKLKRKVQEMEGIMRKRKEQLKSTRRELDEERRRFKGFEAGVRELMEMSIRGTYDTGW